jgi:hypothetical protein
LAIGAGLVSKKTTIQAEAEKLWHTADAPNTNNSKELTILLTVGM